MRKNIKSTFILVLMLVIIYPTNVSLALKGQKTTPNESSIEMDGQIGPWDPGDTDKPDFDSITDIDGKLPEPNDYYTISVTVPINMDFAVVRSNANALGEFYSAKYKITNNATKDVTVKLKGFNRYSTPIPDSSPLYIKAPINGNGKVEVDLWLRYIHPKFIHKAEPEDQSVIAGDKLQPGEYKDVNLKESNKILSNENDKPDSDGILKRDGTKEIVTLGSIKANESAVMKFRSSNWELPESEGVNQNAMSNLNLGFEFSVK